MKDQTNYQNRFKNKGHDCKNLVIRCMDFRFSPYTRELLTNAFADEGDIFEYDSPGVGGGGSKSIIDDSSRSVVVGALDIALSKHHVCRVVIVDHVDCGAYGGSQRFDSLEEEERFHRDQLLKARDILKEKYPEVEIVLFYQDWTSLRLVK